MNKKRIIIFSNSLWNIINFRMSLIENLIKKKFNIYIVAPDSEKKKILIELGCKFQPLNLQRKNLNPLNELKNILKFIYITLKIRPHLIISYTIKPNIYSSIVSFILLKKNIVNFTGLGSVFIKKNFLNRCILLIMKFFFKKTNLVTFQNKSDLKYIVDKIKYLERNSVVIPGSGINLIDYNYDSSFKNRTFKSIKFLMISRILKDKGVNEFFSVSKKILQNHNNIEIFYLGDFDYNNPSFINKATFEKLVLDSNVKYLGYHNDVKEYIVDADVVVLPSFREGLPKSLLEAMAIGRPIIASNVPGCSDLIEEGFNGFTFEITDEIDFYNKMEKIINLSHKDRYIMGLNGRKLVENKFAENIVIDIYLKYINKLIH